MRSNSMEKTVCRRNQCAGCMACIDICAKGAIQIQDSLAAYNAVIDMKKCVNCGACRNICQQNHPAALQTPKEWRQGWSEDEGIRIRGSSGGIASAISRAFVNDGGIVCSCVFRDGKFEFAFAENEEATMEFAGSKYVKSNPRGVFREIRSRVVKGEKVLFIGLPCQVSALKRFIGERLQEKLFTTDLICHGTPSPKLLELFLNQYSLNLSDLQDIRFRMNGKFQLLEGHEGIITTGVTDRYLIAYLNSLSYTENCYRCQYAKTERGSDLTLGDSWGNVLSADEQKRGVSLVLVQTEKGNLLLKAAGVHLESVDVDNAVGHNHQLREPSRAPKGRKVFFREITRDKAFNRLVFQIFPKECLKQDIKYVLIKIGLLKSS